MTNIIKHKRSDVDGRVPTTADLVLGEIAVNSFNGKLFIKRNQNGDESIIQIGGEITVGTTPPQDPVEGDLWVDTN